MPAKSRLIGYMRVSRKRQHVDRQQDALSAAQCVKVFSDKISGKKWKRAGLDAALAAIRPGDRLAVEAVDRLGRSALEILMTIADLHQRGAGLVSLSQGCESTTPNGYIQCMFHAVFAEMEYASIQRRTQDGVNAAAARGKRRGGKPKLTIRQTLQAKGQIVRGKNPNLVAENFRVSRSTLYRHLKATKNAIPPTTM